MSKRLLWDSANKGYSSARQVASLETALHHRVMAAPMRGKVSPPSRRAALRDGARRCRGSGLNYPVPRARSMWQCRVVVVLESDAQQRLAVRGGDEQFVEVRPADAHVGGK